MDPLTAAAALVADRLPDATWAILTGSVLGPLRTPGSDLDIVVLRTAGPGYRESLRYRGWPVELFVDTPDGLARILARELAARKPSTHRMLARGVPVAGDPGDLPARRELREHDPAFAADWAAARDDPAPLAATVLARAGGALFEGYRAASP